MEGCSVYLTVCAGKEECPDCMCMKGYRVCTERGMDVWVSRWFV